MDQFLATLKARGRIVTREVPGKGLVEAVIIEERQEKQPGVFVETWVPVSDFKTMFASPASLAQQGPALGYGKLIEESQKEGWL